MARGSDQATTAATNAGNLSSGLEGNASNIYSTLAPQLQAEAAHPSGISPTDLAAIDTATKQTSGGTQAGATGQGALLAARTRNAGGADAAIANAARSGGEQQSQDTLETQAANEKLKERQQQAGLSGLEGLYNTDTAAGIQSAGQIAPDINANTSAANESWDWAKYILDPLLQSGSSAASRINMGSGGGAKQGTNQQGTNQGTNTVYGGGGGTGYGGWGGSGSYDPNEDDPNYWDPNL